MGRLSSRTGKKIAEFATELLPSFVTAVGSADGTWDTFSAEPALPTAVLFTTKDATTPLYKALSMRFKVSQGGVCVRERERARSPHCPLP